MVLTGLLFLLDAINYITKYYKALGKNLSVSLTTIRYFDQSGQ